MKKVLSIIIAMFVMSITVFAAMTESNFLTMVANESPEDIQIAVSEYGEELGLDLSIYGELTSEQQIEALDQVIGEYENITAFNEELNTISAKILKTSSSSGGSTSTGGSSSGGGGSSSGGSSGSISGGTAAPVFPYTEYNFQGTIYLPEGEVAPEGGIEFEISFPVVSSSDVSYGSGTVGISQPATILSIPSGENSVSYNIDRYIRNNTESIAVKVLLHHNPDEKYLYGNFSDVIEISSSKSIVADVHIQFPDSYINGCFSLGEDAEPLSEKLSVEINLSNTDGIKVYSQIITLPSGNLDVDFKIPVKQGEEYNLTYKANISGINQQHISPNYTEYSETISVNSEEITGVVLEPEYREVVSGTISLPTDMKAPSGGLNIQISGASVVEVTIPENENSVDYTVAYTDAIAFTPIQDNHEEIKYDELVIDETVTDYDVQLSPLYSVYGTISLSSVAIDDVDLRLFASLNNIPNSEVYDEVISITIPEGSMSATYCIEIHDACPIDEVYLAIYDDTYSDKYLHFGGAFSDAISLPKYNNEYTFDTLNIEKAVEVFKGTIQIPQGFVDKESRIIINAYSTTQDLYSTVWTDGESDSVDFVLYGETSDFEMYNGEYVIYITYDDYSWFDIYYNGNDFSVQNKSGITVNDETVTMNIVLPETNLSLSGKIILPTASTEEIEVVLSLCDQNDFSHGDRIITVPANTTIYDFSTSFLARTDMGNYKISYSVSDANTSPYAEGHIVYIAENGYTETIDDAKEFIADNNYPNIEVDISPFECSAIIIGSVTIPFGIVPDEGTYFNVKVVASNGEYEETDIVRFSAGESTKEYSIAIPEMYDDGEWKVYYYAGSASSVPSTPTIKTEVIRDSDFSIPVSSSGGGGNGIGGGFYPVHKIPSRIIRGLNVYYSASGMVFDEQYAKTFVFEGEAYDNIDFTIVTMDMEYPRNIGGYFLSVKDNVEFTVELIDYETGSIVDEKSYISADEATWYEFNVTGEKPYILKFYYEDKEYYYNSDSLTTDKDLAFVIEASSDPNQYKYNVYYENIKMYYQTTNQRYLNFELESPKYSNVNVCIFDKNGMLIGKTYAGTLLTDEKYVYIGFEYCGQIRYLTTFTKKSARTNLLSGTTENISEARMFTLPHISETGVVVNLDISDFTSGTSVGVDGNIAVKESYLNYDELSNSIEVESMYIDIADGILDGDNTLHIAFYGEYGQLIDLKSVTELPADNVIPLGFTLDNDGYIKVMCFQPQLQPMFDVVQFFE